MGLDPISWAVIGLTTLKAAGDLENAEDQATADIRQGEIESMNKAKEVRQRVARAKLSFLNSGISLDGTPRMSLQGMLESGAADVNQIADNANTRAKNTMSAARSKAIGDMTSAASGFSGASLPGIGGNSPQTPKVGVPQMSTNPNETLPWLTPARGITFTG